MCINFALGAITINTPTASQIVNGTFVFNVTTSTATLNNTLNCTFSTTANSNFGITVNTSAGQTVFTNSSNTALLTDASGTTLTVVCRNATASETATRTFTVDNTAPVCSGIILDRTSVDYLDLLGISPTASVSDTTTLTYAWHLWDSNGNSLQTSTSSTPSFNDGDLATMGDLTVGLTLTDETGKSTACTNQTVFVKKSDNSDEQTTQKTIAGSKNSNIPFIIIISVIVLVIIIVACFLIISESKKRGR